MNTFYSFGTDTPQVDPSAFVAPGVILIGNVSIGAQASVWFQSVLRGDINSITIGDETNIQDGCLLHVTHKHPLVVHEKVTVGHGAILHGSTIGSGSLIAMGSIVLDGATIGENCLVGAGSVVPPNMHVPDNSLVMGVPGKIIRKVTQSDRERIQQGWQNYLSYADAYRRQLAESIKSNIKD